MMFFIIYFFSISPLYVRWHLPYTTKDDSSESCFIDERLILGQWKNYLFTYADHLLLIARKCCIVICIVITNTKFVAHRCI